MFEKGKFHILLDSGHGSSGKGSAIARIVDRFDIENVSSNNMPNAGHTVCYEGNEPLVFKALPAAASLRKYKQKPVMAWVGPNSSFDISQFNKELGYIAVEGEGADLTVHSRAAILNQSHIDMESPGGSLSTLAISSTMSGAGASYAMKAMRRPDTKYAGEIVSTEKYCLTPDRFWRATQDCLKSGQSFMHEVSQGFALSLDWGTSPRTCTFRNCTAQQGAADMGVLPSQVGEVVLNLRTYPIRVGNNYDAAGREIGNSGGWWRDQRELTWEEVLASAMGSQPSDVAVRELMEKERTTVTKKVRRVATFSFDWLEHAAAFNGATALAVNFTHYLPGAWSSLGARGGPAEFAAMPSSVKKFVHKCQEVTGLPVIMLGTGPMHEDVIWRV